MAHKKKGHPLANTVGVNAVIDAAHGKATTWTDPLESVQLVARSTEEQLLRDGVPRSAMDGTVVTILSAGPSKGYSYPVIGSKITIGRFREGWRLLSVRRTTRFPAQRQQVTMFVKRRAWQIMIAKLSARYVVLDLVKLPPAAATTKTF